MNAAIYRFAPYTGSLKIEQQTFCLVHSLFQFVWLSEDVYIIPPAFHSVKYFFKKVNKAVKCGEAVTKKLPNRTGLGVLVVPVAGLEPTHPCG